MLGEYTSTPSLDCVDRYERQCHNLYGKGITVASINGDRVALSICPINNQTCTCFNSVRGHVQKKTCHACYQECRETATEDSLDAWTVLTQKRSCG